MTDAPAILDDEEGVAPEEVQEHRPVDGRDNGAPGS